MTIGLLLIDIQNDYFPGGNMVLDGSINAAQNAAKLLDFFRQNHLPLIHIQHIAVRPGATFFLPDTPGVEIYHEVRPLGKEMVIQKHFPNSFRETGLLQHIRSQNIIRLVICGMMSHMCVDATARAAVDFGFGCQVVHDACATHSLKFGDRTVTAQDVHTAFMAAFNSSYGKVLSTIDILAEMEAID
jgi:nicotinamidase-related amidase